MGRGEGTVWGEGPVQVRLARGRSSFHIAQLPISVGEMQAPSSLPGCELIEDRNWVSFKSVPPPQLLVQSQAQLSAVKPWDQFLGFLLSITLTS